MYGNNSTVQLKKNYVYIIIAHAIMWGYSGLYIVYTGENSAVKTVLECDHLTQISIDNSQKLTFGFDSYDGQITVVEFGN